MATDQFVGTLTFFRVYSGVLNSGDQVYNANRERRERIGRMVQMHSNSRAEIKEVRAGDIAAAIGLKGTTTGDTLCDGEQRITLERMDFPDPVISVAVEPKSVADQEKMSSALGKLAQEDPSFAVATDDESGQTIISGMGELHLDILVERMRREYGVEANIGKPQVAYRETIRAEVDQEAKYIRQTGGRGQYGHIWVKLEPTYGEEDAPNFEFVDQIVGRRGAARVHPGRGQGLGRADGQRRSGRLSAHQRAGDFARWLVPRSGFQRDGVQDRRRHGHARGRLRARPVLLEPVMAVEVVTPEDYMGDVVGDLSRRRGLIDGMDENPSGKIVRASVPLAEMFGYSTDLRSATQGRATFTMEFSRYAEVPDNIAAGIIKKS